MDIKYLPCDKPKICKNCGAEFPNWVEIDGRRKNMQCRSYCFECSPFKGTYKRHSKYKMVDGNEFKLCAKCKEWKCISTDWHTSLHKNGNIYTNSYCKECQNKTARDLASDLKSRSVSYKGSKCLDCGVSFPDYIYDFHHRNPEEKDFKISNHLTRFKDWALVKIELDKCDMLCAHCHRHRHYDTNHPFYCPSK